MSSRLTLIMIKTVLIFGLFFVSAVFFSCTKEGLKSPSASYVIFNNPVLSVPSASMGASSHKITDLWFYVNDAFQGCYPVGGIIPIVATGNAEIKVFAGIRNNGIGSTRQPYIMYKQISFNQSLEFGVTYTINPIFEYNSQAKFIFHEEFEGLGSLFQSMGDSSFVIISDPAKTFGGNGKSLFMGMSNTKPTAKIISSISYPIPLSGSYGTRVYLEMNYKCNQKISIGLIGGGEERPAITLNPTDDWNKIYIELTTIVNTQPTYNFYKVFIGATKSADVANPEIYIDNLKVVTE